MLHIWIAGSEPIQFLPKTEYENKQKKNYHKDQSTGKGTAHHVKKCIWNVCMCVNVLWYTKYE